jgi:hypothetical protein
VLRRHAIDEIAPDIRSNGSAYGFEMLLAVARRRVPMVQVPVNYLPRVGESSVTGDFLTSVRLGLSMIRLCLAARFSPRYSRRVGA